MKECGRSSLGLVDHSWGDDTSSTFTLGHGLPRNGRAGGEARRLDGVAAKTVLGLNTGARFKTAFI